MLRILVTCLILLNTFFFGSHIYRSYVKIDHLTKERTLILEKKKAALESIDEYDTLLNKINDSYYREKIARDKLQMKKEGEIIYRSINTK